jgi:hypothetical protein
MNRRFFPKVFDKRENCFYSGEILWTIWRLYKEGPLKRTYPNRVTCWEHGEVRILGLFERKSKCISGFLLLNTGDSESWIWEGVWDWDICSSSKANGLIWADIKLWGKKKRFTRPRIIGKLSAWNQQVIGQSINRDSNPRTQEALCCTTLPYNLKPPGSEWSHSILSLCLCWHTNLFECGYVENIRDPDRYKKKDCGFTQHHLSTIHSQIN